MDLRSERARLAAPESIRALPTTRPMLLAGFGGLLALMLVAGIGTLRILQTIQHRNNQIRSDFLARNRLLNRIRSDLYLSGTFVRDYLLEPDPAKAAANRANLTNGRADMENALATYSGMLRPGEDQPFRTLTANLSQYWTALNPAMLWNAADRQTRGYAFLRDQVYPRRSAMLGLADQIGAVDERQLDAADLQLSELFSSVRERFIVILVFTLVLGALLAAFSIRRTLQLEQEASARLDETAKARAELKELSARLVEAQEAERRAISRELHDEVGQSLSALTVGLSNLKAPLAAGQSALLAAQIEDLRKLAESSVGVVRNMTLLLRPSMLDDLGLVPALQWQAREISKRSGLNISLHSGDVSDDLPDEHKTAIYRVVQEALHNCEKHAFARQVRVTVRQQPDTLLLSIQDDGCGFSPSSGLGVGIRGMQERIANLGGMFSIESGTTGTPGTLITIRLPLSRSLSPVLLPAESMHG